MCSISKNDQCSFFRCFFPCTIIFCMFRHTSTVIKTASHDLQSFFQSKYFYQFPELINSTPWLPLTSRLSPPVDIPRKFCIIIASCIPRKIIQICIASFFQIGSGLFVSLIFLFVLCSIPDSFYFFPSSCRNEIHRKSTEQRRHNIIPRDFYGIPCT